MPNYDYACSQGHIHEVRCSIAEKPVDDPCPECGELSKSIVTKMPSVMTHVIPSYPGSKKQAAGYQHTHGDRKGTKTQSGYGGMVQASTEAPATSDAIWKNPLAD